MMINSIGRHLFSVFLLILFEYVYYVPMSCPCTECVCVCVYACITLVYMFSELRGE